MERQKGVSIIVPTYNHEKYIAQALDSFLMQKTSFPIEVLVHDDASTDSTAEIIKDYEKRFPNIIKPVLQTENQYSKGVNVEQTFLMPKCQYCYTAMCDGDDYWIDDTKLQKQFDALEQHPDIDICAHRATAIDANTGESVGFQGPSDTFRIFTPEEVINGDGGFVATGSIVYRTKLDDKIPEFRKINELDYGVQIDGSLRGGMIYFGDCMSAYRISVAGSWTARIQANPDKAIPFYKTMDDMFVSLDSYTNGRFKKLIEKKRTENRFRIYEAQGKYRKLFEKEFKTIIQKTPRSTVIKYRLGCLFPKYILNRERRKNEQQ